MARRDRRGRDGRVRRRARHATPAQARGGRPRFVVGGALLPHRARGPASDQLTELRSGSSTWAEVNSRPCRVPAASKRLDVRARCLRPIGRGSRSRPAKQLPDPYNSDRDHHHERHDDPLGAHIPPSRFSRSVPLRASGLMPSGREHAAPSATRPSWRCRPPGWLRDADHLRAFCFRWLRLDRVVGVSRPRLSTVARTPCAPAPDQVTCGFESEPAVGFEPTTCCLQDSCSTPELRRRNSESTCRRSPGGEGRTRRARPRARRRRSAKPRARASAARRARRRPRA